MPRSKPKVLFISSVSPYLGPGSLMLDYYHGFKELGIEADFLTMNPVEGYPDIDYIFDNKNKAPFLWKLYSYVRNVWFYRHRFFKVKKGTHFFYRYEEFPPLPNHYLLKKIDKQYDLVLVLFWQGMLSFSSIKAIYEKLHCQIQFLGVDYSQVAGGCHFLGDCEEYKTGCKKCDYIEPKWCNHFTAHNVQYRKKVYDLVKPIVWGNSYMRSFYDQSYLLKNAKKELSTMIMDLDVFRPFDKNQLRQKYGVGKDVKYIIGFGCQGLDDVRKGIRYLVEALNRLYSNLHEKERLSILVLTVGRASEELTNKIPFEQKHLGYVKLDVLPEFYSLADVYLSPCVNDAGPSMVNQSLCCGTPVISFEIGTALDCIKGHNTGICVPLKDSKAFAGAIELLYRKDEEGRKAMSDSCREYAETHYSRMIIIKNILDVYHKYSDK